MVVMVAVVAFLRQFIARHPISKIKPIHHSHFLQQMHGTVNRDQVAQLIGQGRKDLLDAERMIVSAQRVQHRLAGGGHAPRLAAQAVCNI
ncbi:MAG: hypothetical protein WCJ30_12625, partial [Deltaproteobacteria bacterium]